tara:strand:- start:244 stop:903 length:660 start_codon:yes stop_codon:yes gene_type:complete
MRLKTLSIVAFYFFLMLIPESGTAQEINGIVKSKTSTIYFEGFGFENTLFNGEIHSNISGLKYTIHLKNEQDVLEGEVLDKLSKFSVDLNYKGKEIKGEIHKNLTGTKDTWDLQFLEHKLTGTVIYNLVGTTCTYNLSYDNIKITGEIHEKLNSIEYDLLFDTKKITGSMTTNFTGVKHTYRLEAEELSEDEFVVFLFIESIKLMNERIAEIDDFQNEN